MYSLLRPLLFRLDAESAHHAAMRMGRVASLLTPGFIANGRTITSPGLRQDLLGMSFPNPVSIAAGLDKNAELLAFWQQAGFGFVEVGSVSALPSSGNPRPRSFRLVEDEAIINRMGLNNHGASVVARRIGDFRSRIRVPLGVNVAKTHSPEIMGDEAIRDFVQSFEAVAPVADYIALNISCPNTAEGKTFEDPVALAELLDAVLQSRSGAESRVPILLKLSPADPGSEEVQAILDVIESRPIDGLIATNTASDREGLKAAPKELERIGNGGLSGAPLRSRSTALIRHLYKETDGQLPIIGVGGIDSVDAAWEKITAGASLVQLYTGLVYRGPGLVRTMLHGLEQRLEDAGFANVGEAVGTNAS